MYIIFNRQSIFKSLFLQIKFFQDGNIIYVCLYIKNNKYKKYFKMKNVRIVICKILE